MLDLVEILFRILYNDFKIWVIVMNKKRLIVTSVISIILVSILFIGSTYSIFTSRDVDENLNVYKTGTLGVTYTLSSEDVILTDVTPISIENSDFIVPYRITVKNTGNVPYMFQVILADTTAGEVIDYQYLYTQVGKLEPRILKDCSKIDGEIDGENYIGRVLKDQVILPANGEVIIDVKVWISDQIKNTEIGKSFYGKLVIDGEAIYDVNTDIDNSVLIANYSKPYLVTLNHNDASSIGTTSLYGISGTLKVGLYLDDGYGEMMTSSVNPIVVPTKEGYTFEGYYTDFVVARYYIDQSIGNVMLSFGDKQKDSHLDIFGVGYEFDQSTGVYTLIQPKTMDIWKEDTEIMASYPYTCALGMQSSCSTLYKVMTYDKDAYMASASKFEAALSDTYSSASGTQLLNAKGYVTDAFRMDLYSSDVVLYAKWKKE